MPMTPNEYITADADHLTPAELADLATHLLLDEVPCHFCGKVWMARDYDHSGDCETCDDCHNRIKAEMEAEFDQQSPEEAKQALKQLWERAKSRRVAPDVSQQNRLTDDRH